MLIKIVTKLVLIVLIMVLPLCPAMATTLETVYKITGFQFCESITSDGTNFYVGNVGSKLEPSSKDSDGYISLVSSKGEVLDKKYLPLNSESLNAPKGMVVDNNTLYVADIDRIVGFDIHSRERVFELGIKDSKFLNGMTMKTQGVLFVSDTGSGIIYEVDTALKSYKTLLINKDLKGPNGLKYNRDKDTLTFVEWGSDNKPNGRLVSIKLSGEQEISSSEFNGYLDGIVELSSHEWLISDWVNFETEGKLVYYNQETNRKVAVSESQKMGGPADIFIAKDKRIWIPAMLEGIVYVMEFK